MIPGKDYYISQLLSFIEDAPEDLPEEQREIYEKVKGQIPANMDKKVWLNNQRDEIDSQLEIANKKVDKTREEALEYRKERSEKMIAETQAKIAYSEKMMEECKKNGDSYAGYIYQIEVYNKSIRALKDPSTTQFSMNLVSWELSTYDYKPYIDARRDLREIEMKSSDLSVFGKVQKAYDEVEEARAVAHEMLNEKQSNFDKLNGWQKFWAKVLPASWYSKAEQYRDIKDLKEAMKVVGVSEPVREEPVQENPVREPLSDNEITGIEKANELDQPEIQVGVEKSSPEAEIDLPVKGN